MSVKLPVIFGQTAYGGRTVETSGGHRMMRPNENNDVSVVIPTKNSAWILERCLKSVVKEKPKEILGVDMLSNDETPGILRRYGAKILVNSTASLSLSRQLGVEAAKGALLMFVDSDIELEPGCVATLCSELDKYGWVGIHARVLSRENVSYWQKSEDEAFRLFYNRVGPKDQIGTAAAVFRREILLAHPFDRNLTTSFEDVDLCRRLRKDGYRLGISSAFAYHLHKREFSAFIRRRFRTGVGMAAFALKYKSISMLIAPLRQAFLQIVRSMLTGRIRLVPYWLAGGLGDFLGLVVGLSRIGSFSHRQIYTSQRRES